MKNLFTALFGIFVIASVPAIADETNRDNPEAKAGPKDNPEARKGPADSPEAKKGPRDNPEAKANLDGDKPGATSPANRKHEKVFRAYDKNQDGMVDADEIAGMREGKLSSSQRREIRKQIKEFDTDKTKGLDLEEFIKWRTRGAKEKG